MIKIIKNAIRCNSCGEVIVSESRHSYVTCKCGCCAVDGGKDYLRRSSKYGPDGYTELSECEEVADNIEKQ